MKGQFWMLCHLRCRVIIAHQTGGKCRRTAALLTFDFLGRTCYLLILARACCLVFLSRRAASLQLLFWLYPSSSLSRFSRQWATRRVSTRTWTPWVRTRSQTARGRARRPHTLAITQHTPRTVLTHWRWDLWITWYSFNAFFFFFLSRSLKPFWSDWNVTAPLLWGDKRYPSKFFSVFTVMLLVTHLMFHPSGLLSTLCFYSKDMRMFLNYITSITSSPCRCELRVPYWQRVGRIPSWSWTRSGEASNMSLSLKVEAAMTNVFLWRWELHIHTQRLTLGFGIIKYIHVCCSVEPWHITTKM